jgi:hypothetical protein
VVDLHRHRVDVGLERLVRIGERRKFICHVSGTPFVN